MASKKQDDILKNLPASAADFIKVVIRNMRYRKAVQRDVKNELAAHFEDELKDCKDEKEKEQKAKQIIDDFGDPKLLGVLMRRAKKRCRSLWGKCLVQTSKIIGLIFLYIVIRSVFIAAGKPSINIDYIDWLNKFVAAGRPEVENARMYYDRAAELSVNAPMEIAEKVSAFTVKDYNSWFADLNDLQADSFLKWLADNQQSLEALKQGSQKPYYWPVYESRKSGQIQEILVPDTMKVLPKYRLLARAMSYQIMYDEYKGKEADALNDCLVLYKFGINLEGKGLLIEQMVGNAIEALAVSSVFRLLQRPDIPADMLKDFHTKLENVLCNAGPIMNFEAEKAFWYDLVQRGFTDNGKGNGRVLPKGLPLVMKDAPSFIADFFFWNYPDRHEVMATIDNCFEQAENLLEKTPCELHHKDKSQIWDEMGKQSFMLQMIGPPYGKVNEMCWRLKTHRTALRTVITILVYEREKGRYPINLDELVSSGFLKELPMDPYSDKPLVYRKTETGFTLYSIGNNFVDDGGKMGVDDKGQPRLWQNNGDNVFWPVQK
jgi:hypothetical protein